MTAFNADFTNMIPAETITTASDKMISTQRSSGRCLSLDMDGGDLDELLAKYSQVIVTPEAKASGSSFKEFMVDCKGRDNNYNYPNIDNVLNGQKLKEALMSQLEVPDLIVSHAHDAFNLQNQLRHVTKNTLIIYLHREGTNRRKSAIRHVAAERLCCKEHEMPCDLQELELFGIIKERKFEIGGGDDRILTCASYKAIEDSVPNFVFMDYREADRLMKLLAKYKCPGAADILSRDNTKDQKRRLSVELEANKELVDLDDWLDAKIELLELATLMKDHLVPEDGHTCQGTTRRLEYDLDSCTDRTLLFSSTDFSDRSS
jgi:hypothetical protein